MSDAVTLLEAVRAEAKPGIWSNGVKLARAGAVVQESTDGKEVVLRVKAGGRPVPWTVVLYPKDGAWECNCPASIDPCEHSVAAAITLFGLESGAALATVVGVLIEVPVMLAVVKVVNASRDWYEAGRASGH